MGGHLEVLKWLRDNGCPWGEFRAGARRTQNLEVLKWLRVAAQWGELTCEFAAQRGDLEC